MFKKKRKKIVLYFGKKRKSLDPFKSFKLRRKVYYELFRIGESLGFEMYVSSGRKFYFGDLNFGNILKYENGFFKKIKENIKADAVYDKSGGISFPPSRIGKKVLNNIEFKKLCADKMLIYKLIGEFMPESFPVANKKELKECLSNFKDSDMVVFKPVDNFGGKGVVIGHPKEIRSCFISRSTKYKLQRFIETKAGIAGIVKGRHDLRIIVINGKIITSQVRVPVKGGFLANVAQGGSIKEIPVKKIPHQIIKIIKEIQSKIDKNFDSPIYSIDFGVENGKPYVFELNDRIGVPTIKMNSYEKFNKEIIKALKKRGERR